jgi:hypothetical protein
MTGFLDFERLGAAAFFMDFKFIIPLPFEGRFEKIFW